MRRYICVVVVMVCCGGKSGFGIVLVSIYRVNVVAVSPVALGMLLVEIVGSISPIAVGMSDVAGWLRLWSFRCKLLWECSMLFG